MAVQTVVVWLVGPLTTQDPGVTAPQAEAAHCGALQFTPCSATSQETVAVKVALPPTNTGFCETVAVTEIGITWISELTTLWLL
jgi:hypothetical protein